MRADGPVAGGSAGTARPTGPGDRDTLDHDSRAWVRDLSSEGPEREGAVARLHELLLRVARAEARRRRPRIPDAVASDLDDLCAQAASDAVVAILHKLHGFRGAARFTTWACKFVILEFSARLRRRMWEGREVPTDGAVWDRLPDARPTAQESVEHHEVLDVLGRAVERDLSDRQRLVFTQAVLHEVPIDVLAERLGSTRGAVYKTVFDARSKLRGALVRAGLEGVLA